MHVISKGKVSDVNDPAKAGRIQCELAETDGQVYPEWINPIFLGNWLFMPDVGETVLIIKPDDDEIVEFPEDVYYLGTLKTQENPFDDTLGTNYPKRVGFKTKAGHFLMVDGTPGQEEITLAHKGILLFSLTNAGMFLGSAAATEPMVLGNAWKTLMGAFMTAYADHKHGSGTGPTSVPDNAGTVTTLKSGVNANNQLSDFIFGQKLKPS